MTFRPTYGPLNLYSIQVIAKDGRLLHTPEEHDGADDLGVAQAGLAMHRNGYPDWTFQLFVRDGLSGILLPLKDAASAVPEAVPPAGWAAVIHTSDGPRCFGWGVRRADAMTQASRQFLGAGNRYSYMMHRVELEPLTAEEASDLAEMLDTPWT